MNKSNRWGGGFLLLLPACLLVLLQGCGSSSNITLTTSTEAVIPWVIQRARTTQSLFLLKPTPPATPGTDFTLGLGYTVTNASTTGYTLNFTTASNQAAGTATIAISGNTVTATFNIVPPALATVTGTLTLVYTSSTMPPASISGTLTYNYGTQTATDVYSLNITNGFGTQGLISTINTSSIVLSDFAVPAAGTITANFSTTVSSFSGSLNVAPIGATYSSSLQGVDPNVGQIQAQWTATSATTVTYQTLNLPQQSLGTADTTTWWTLYTFP